MDNLLREDILNLLKGGRALDFIQISDELNYSKELDEKIMKTLNKMVDEFELCLTNKNKYMLFSENEKNKNVVKGKFLDTKGTSGFVQVEGMDDIYIHGKKTLGAMEGDTVLVLIKKRAVGEYKAEGEVLKIINREVNHKVGEIYHFNKKMMVSLDDKKYKKLIYLENNEQTRRLVDGDKVVVEFSSCEKDKDYVKAKFIKRLGHINDPGIDILSIVANHEIETEFSEESIKELATIPVEVKKKDLIGLRDLRDEMIFTIDGDDTKDIDDAISVKILPNHHYQLGVHIAHVSHYIKENSHLDIDARNRGTSVYLVDRVIPMFPHQISNGICSLNPGVDRITMSCEMEIDDQGKLIKYDIFPSVIRSRKQMTYGHVNEILEKGIVPKGYEEYADTIKLMNELAHIIRQERTKRGAIDFDTDEAKIIVDKTGKPLEIKLRERGEGEKLIEDFMVRANETVASHFFFMELPSIYRVHGEPKEERLLKFLTIVNNLGMNVKGDIKKINCKMVQKLVNELKTHEEFKVLVTKLLGSMDKAIYSPENIGHFALASKIYTHFTSPIRRYPDLMIHRMLDAYFFSEEGLTEEKVRHFTEILPDICENSSERERNSEECERDVDDMKMAEYMESHIGEEFEGMISGVTNFGIFVQLNNLIEGMIPIETFGNNYDYDKNTETIRVGNEIFKLGDKLIVQVVRADKATSEIDFEIVERVKESE